MAYLTNKDRINTVNFNRCVVYRLGREELGNNTNIVQRTGGSGENTAYLRFKMNGTGSTQWEDFKNWWKKNSNAILLGLMVYNGNPNQNRGYYWCPTNRTPNPARPDAYTNYLEFIIQRDDAGIYDNSSDCIYEFYFINLSH